MVEPNHSPAAASAATGTSLAAALAVAHLRAIAHTRAGRSADAERAAEEARAAYRATSRADVLVMLDRDLELISLCTPDRRRIHGALTASADAFPMTRQTVGGRAGLLDQS